jgi:hypothetical protein
MRINYNKVSDYRKALEESKRIVASNYAIADARLKSAKAAGEMIEDDDYTSFLAWQLLSVLVRTQELTCDPDDFEDEDYDDVGFEEDFDIDLDDEE